MFVAGRCAGLLAAGAGLFGGGEFVFLLSFCAPTSAGTISRTATQIVPSTLSLRLAKLIATLPTTR
ncbi:MAG: hypothetical protein WCC59_01885, partial [Terriglobales bacterium]